MGGCSSYDVPAPWSDLVIFFHQKLCQGCPICYAKFQRDPHSGSVAISENLTGVVSVRLQLVRISPRRARERLDAPSGFFSRIVETIFPLPYNGHITNLAWLQVTEIEILRCTFCRCCCSYQLLKVSYWSLKICSHGQSQMFFWCNL